MGILATDSFTLQSTYHKTKDKSLGHFVFGWDIILPINHVVDWRCIRQRKKAKIDKDVISEKTNIIDHDYRVGDKLMTWTKSAYKYETPFRGTYDIIHTWINETVTL